MKALWNALLFTVITALCIIGLWWLWQVLHLAIPA